MLTWRWVFRAFVLMTAVVLFTAGSCDDDDQSAADDAVAAAIAQAQQAQNDTGGSADNQQQNTSAGSGDFQTVYGIAPFGTATVDPAFGAYEFRDDDFQCSETVFFQVVGADRDQLIEYYTDTLTAAGYTIGPPLELGGSIAVNVSMDNDPAVSGVIQIGPLSPTDPTLGVNQQRNRFKEPVDEGGGGDGGSSGTVADDASDASSESQLGADDG